MVKNLKITKAQSPENLEQTRELFCEYQKEIDVDLCFQSFEEELTGLPGKYAEPEGVILLAYWKLQLAGCVALRPIQEGICEMKRLFVRREFKGKGIGKALALAIIQEGKDRNYRKMHLDTLERLQPAVRLYQKLGFTPIDAYYNNPFEGVVYFSKVLTEEDSQELPPS